MRRLAKLTEGTMDDGAYDLLAREGLLGRRKDKQNALGHVCVLVQVGE